MRVRASPRALLASWSNGLGHRCLDKLSNRWDTCTMKIYNHNQGYLRVCVGGELMLEHRYVIKMALGRSLRSDEVVHHKNEDRKDNRVENLELTDSSTHAVHHASRRFMITHVQLRCDGCGLPFFRRKSKVVFGKKSGQQRSYCSRECMESSRRKEIKHGTLTTYFRCGPPRCSLCKKAMRDYQRARRSRS